MSIRQIEKEEWKDYFDVAFSKKYLKDEEPEYVEITVLDRSAGTQLESGRLLSFEVIQHDGTRDIIETR